MELCVCSDSLISQTFWLSWQTGGFERLMCSSFCLLCYGTLGWMGITLKRIRNSFQHLSFPSHECVCVCVCVCVCGSGMLICFVSALGSHEMGRHKLPIIIMFWGLWLALWLKRRLHILWPCLSADMDLGVPRVTFLLENFFGNFRAQLKPFPGIQIHKEKFNPCKSPNV